MVDRSKYCHWMTHTWAFNSRREQLGRIWKSTHLESYNCCHIRYTVEHSLQLPILLQTALSGLSRIVFGDCRDSDVGIIAEFHINYGTVPERIRQRQDLDLIGNGNEKCIQIMPVHHDSVPIHRTPSRHSNRAKQDDYNLTRQNRRSFPNVTGRASLSGVLGRLPRTIPNPAIRLRSDDRTFQIIEDSNTLFSLFVSYTVSSQTGAIIGTVWTPH